MGVFEVLGKGCAKQASINSSVFGMVAMLGRIIGLRSQKLWALIIAFSAQPAFAETANFGTFSLVPGFRPAQGIVQGYTGGSLPLSTLAKSSLCLGFSDPAPDHIMVLQKNFSRLKLQVNSRGQDTTLLVQGPKNKLIGCGDDTGKDADASVTASNLKAGVYRIWVGSFEPGSKYDYTLSVEE